MKKLLFITIMMVFFFGLFSCTTKEGKENEQSTTFISVSINPELGLFVNDEGIVLQTVALNDDGDILLADLDLTGSDVEDAVETIVSEATDAGYIDEQDGSKKVRICAFGNKEQSDKFTKKICDKVNKFFNNHHLPTNIEIDNLDEYVSKAQELGISRHTFKLIMIALNLNDELTFDTLVTYEEDELIKLCQSYVQEFNCSFKGNEQFKEDKLALKEEYAQLFTLCEEIKALEEQLANTTDEEDLVNLKATLEEKIALRDELFTEYHQKLQALKEEYKDSKQKDCEYFKGCKEDRIRQHYGHNGKGPGKK